MHGNSQSNDSKWMDASLCLSNGPAINWGLCAVLILSFCHVMRWMWQLMISAACDWREATRFLRRGAHCQNNAHTLSSERSEYANSKLTALRLWRALRFWMRMTLMNCFYNLLSKFLAQFPITTSKLLWHTHSSRSWSDCKFGKRNKKEKH